MHGLERWRFGWFSSCLLATTWADVLDERKWRQGYAGDLV